jgi:2-keto-4-pentenoate hydratase/2-oxohepta-3-ene-1,7-dioic acid hydratase in catechol pathway
MKLVSFLHAGAEPRLGLWLDDGRAVLDLASPLLALPEPHGFNGAFDLDGAFLREARALARRCESAGERDELRARGLVLAREAVRLTAPVPRPGKIVCIGKNYREHADEMAASLPERPLLFSKFATSVNAPGGVVPIPRGCRRFDYEAELAVVIGRRATRVARGAARTHVLGYCCFDDFTARDFQKLDGQWQRGKSGDGLAPFGPYLATTDELPDPHVLRIRLRLGGRTMQDGTRRRT